MQLKARGFVKHPSKGLWKTLGKGLHEASKYGILQITQARGFTKPPYKGDSKKSLCKGFVKHPWWGLCKVAIKKWLHEAPIEKLPC